MSTSQPNPLHSRLSKIGLGCGTFGREIDQAAAFAMLDHAYARKIAYFDTAEGGGKYAGVSERIIGAWLASRKPKPASVLVASKLMAPYSAGEIEARVMESLRRLGLETVDLLYFWDWDDSAADPGVLAALDRMVLSGRIGALGASNFDHGQLERVLRLQSENGWARIRALQKNNNFAVREVDEPLRALCVREDVAIVTYSPLGAGFLTGKHKEKVEPGSRFDIAPGHQAVYFHDVAWRRLAELEAISARTGKSVVHLALAWVLHQPGIASVLVGGRTPGQIDQAFAGQSIDPVAILGEAR